MKNAEVAELRNVLALKDRRISVLKRRLNLLKGNRVNEVESAENPAIPMRDYDVEAHHKSNADLNIYPATSFTATSKTNALEMFRKYLRDTGVNLNNYRLVAFRGEK